jgi:hypothetical protein
VDAQEIKNMKREVEHLTRADEIAVISSWAACWMDTANSAMVRGAAAATTPRSWMSIQS